MADPQPTQTQLDIHSAALPMPWGYSPVERYLIANWDPTSNLAPTDQRLALIRKYLASEPIERDGPPPSSAEPVDYMHHPHFKAVAPPVAPTDEQIIEILMPWRDPQQRLVALQAGEKGNPLWIRTCYEDGTEEEYEDILDGIDQDMAFADDYWRMLDDEIYEYGDDWRRILDIMPELVAGLGPCNHTPVSEEERQAFCASLEGLDAEDRAMKIESSRRQIQEKLVQNYLIVVDEEALETKMLLFVFLDAHGDVVRQVRLEPSLTEEVSGGWSDGGGWQHFFEDGTVGPKYQPDSDFGRIHYLI